MLMGSLLRKEAFRPSNYSYVYLSKSTLCVRIGEFEDKINIIHQ